MSLPVILPAGTTFFKSTFNFAVTQSLTGGWSESYYWSGSTLNAAQTAATALLAVRTQLMQSPAVCQSIRITQFPGTFRTVLKYYPPGSDGQGIATTANGPAPVWIKGMLRLVGTNGQYTNQWLGGPPYNIVGQNGSYTPTAQFSGYLRTFLSTLAGQWYIKKVTQGIAGGVNSAYAKQIGVTIAGAGVLTCANHGFTSGQLVSVGRWPDGSGINGIWPVTVISANTFTLNGWTPPATLPNPTKSSYVQLYGWTFTAIGSNTGLAANGYLPCAIVRITKHDIGRPRDQYIGRRKHRVR